MNTDTKDRLDDGLSLARLRLERTLLILLAMTAAINAAVIIGTDFGQIVIEGEGGTAFLQPDTDFFARRVQIEIALVIGAVALWLSQRRGKAKAAAITVVSLVWVVVEYLFWFGGYFIRSDTSESLEFYRTPHIIYLQKANWLDVWIIALVIVCLVWKIKRLIRRGKFPTR